MSESADMPPPAPEAVHQRQSAARLAFGAAVVALALWTFSEYLPALGWAGVIAIATWRFYQRARARVGYGHALPIVFALGVGLIFLAPVVGLGWVAEREGIRAGHWIEEARKNGVPAPESLENLKYVGPSVAAWWRENLADPENARSLVRGFDKAPLLEMSRHVGVAAGRRLVVFLFTILALFFMYRDGDGLAAALGRLSERAFGPRGREIGGRIVNSVHGTVDGLVLVGLGEGLILAIVYYFAGVPQALLLGAATAIGAIIPFGAFVMFSLASILLIAQGAAAAAVVVFVAGLAVLTIADHVVRPYIIGNATRLPFLFVLVGILGGVEAFGMLGLFLGPAIMTILVDLWREATA
jgi:predicted PurR-regulated permease PerM